MWWVAGRRGLILIPKGCGGRGWSGFATELRKVKAFFDAPEGIGATTVSQCQVCGGSFSLGKEASFDHLGLVVDLIWRW